jgi:hypothetical protein
MRDPNRRNSPRGRRIPLKTIPLVLIVTAGNLLKPEGQDSHSADNIMIRTARTLFQPPVAPEPSRSSTSATMAGWMPWDSANCVKTRLTSYAALKRGRKSP